MHAGPPVLIAGYGHWRRHRQRFYPHTLIFIMRRHGMRPVGDLREVLDPPAKGDMERASGSLRFFRSGARLDTTDPSTPCHDRHKRRTEHFRFSYRNLAPSLSSDSVERPHSSGLECWRLILQQLFLRLGLHGLLLQGPGRGQGGNPTWNRVDGQPA